VALTLTEGGMATFVQLTHEPEMHVAGDVQVVVQLPQCELSVCSLTHAPLHPL
jgi:hypothetical protein